MNICSNLECLKCLYCRRDEVRLHAPFTSLMTCICTHGVLSGLGSIMLLFCFALRALQYEKVSFAPEGQMVLEAWWE